MRKITSLIAAMGLLAITTVAAHADTSVGATITSNANGLAVTSPAATSFSTTLDGTDQVLYTSLGSFQVTDPRGTGTGWHVAFNAGQLTTGTHSLAAGSLSMAGLSGSCANSGCTGSVNGFSSETAIDNGSVKVAYANADNGMGTYTLAPSDFAGHAGNHLKLVVPSGTYAGSYTSTITITIADLPA